MVFAGLAASAAVDLLSLLQPEKPGSGGTRVRNASFSPPEFEADAAVAQPTVASGGGSSQSLSSDALGTLLSAQGQGQANAAHHKKHSMSVLLDLLQSSQDGSVTKSDFERALDGNNANASDMFDRIDQDHDNSVNATELSAFFDTYRRNAAATGAAGKGRTLAIAA